MIRINLLPREEKAKRKAAKIAIPAGDLVVPIAVAGVAVAVVAVAALQQGLQIGSLERSVAQVEAQSRELAPQIERVNQLTRERAELDLRLGIITRLEEGRTGSVRLMDELARCVPDHLWLARAAQDASGSLVLEGVTTSNLVVSDFMTRLERSSMFNDVQLSAAERGQVERESFVKFNLKCSVSPEPEAN